MTAPALHLASSSPRRRDILTSIGLPYTYAGVDIDESHTPGEVADDLVLRLALGKAKAVDLNRFVGKPILAADTVVTLDGQVFGKPVSKEHAISMLATLSNQTHRVLTAVVVRKDGEYQSVVSSTDVRFRDIHPDEAAAYWQSGEPADKAGGYAIQGYGGIFVEQITGSYSGVVGLPVFETAVLLQQAGIRVLPRALS